MANKSASKKSLLSKNGVSFYPVTHANVVEVGDSTVVSLTSKLSTIESNISSVSSTASSAATAAAAAASAASAAQSTADSKYALPTGGIPKTDLASAVQTSLGNADSAVQSVVTGDSNLLTVSGTTTRTATPKTSAIGASATGLAKAKDVYDKVVELQAAIDAKTSFKYEVTTTDPKTSGWATADKMGKIWLYKPSGKTSYIEYVVVEEGTTSKTYKAEPLGDTAIELENYYTKTETDNKLSAKVPTSRTVAGLGLSDNITAEALGGALPKLGSTTVGSATKPIYLNDGVPTAGTYTLGAACAKAVDTSMSSSSTSTNLPTTKAVVDHVKNEVATLTTEIGKKADETYVDTELAKKANIADLKEAAYYDVATSLASSPSTSSVPSSPAVVGYAVTCGELTDI